MLLLLEIPIPPYIVKTKAENKTADHELNTENTMALICIDTSKEQTASITGA